MKILATFVLLLTALGWALVPSAAVRAGPSFDGSGKEKGEKDGGKTFDDPKEDEEEESEPIPAVYTLKDYRLELATTDSRFFKEIPITQEEVDKGSMLRLLLKLPKTEEAFDAQIIVNGWPHTAQFDFDGKKVGTSNYKMIADLFFENDLKEWQDVRDPEKPRGRPLNREFRKAYHYALTGKAPGQGFPLRKQVWLIKHKDKTYAVYVLLPTGAMKNENVTKLVDGVVTSIRERRPERN